MADKNFDTLVGVWAWLAWVLALGVLGLVRYFHYHLRDTTWGSTVVSWLRCCWSEDSEFNDTLEDEPWAGATVDDMQVRTGCCWWGLGVISKHLHQPL